MGVTAKRGGKVSETRRAHWIVGLLSGIVTLTGLGLAHSPRLDLRGAALHGVALDGAELRGADVRGADLSVTTLVGAVLRGAVLRVANLMLSVLPGAK